jgi:hypothetical protein
VGAQISSAWAWSKSHPLHVPTYCQQHVCSRVTLCGLLDGIFTLRTSCSIETCEFHRVLVSIRPPLLCLVRQTLFPNYKQPCGKQRRCEQGQVTKTAPHSLRVLPTSDGVTFGFGRREEFKVVTAFIRLVSKEVNLLEVAMLLHVLQAVGLVPTDWKYIKADLQTPT